MVFDGRIGIVGGRNIENKYYDYDLHFNFIDRDVLVIGPVAQDMVKSFNEYWDNDITVELHQLHDVHENLFSNGIQNLFGELELLDLGLFDNLVGRSVDYEYINKQFVETSYLVDNVKFSSDHPEKAFLKNGEAEDQTIQDLTNIIDNAKTSLLMQTPYFILSNPAYKFFLNKRKQNPEIKFIAVTNSLASNDHYVVYALSFKRKKRNVKKLGFQIHEMKSVPNDIESLVPRYRSLLEVSDEQESTNMSNNMSELTEQFQPVQITEAGPRFCIHAKTLVVDSSIAMIGSHNFDPRSLKINTESTLIIYDINFARAVQENIEIITAPQNSWVIAKRQKVPVLGLISGILENISRLLPVFDLWPFRYTSSFELLEGKTPVAITHPDFYQHYRDVGQFPQTAMGDRQLRTYMVSAFGAVAEPQM